MQPPRAGGNDAGATAGCGVLEADGLAVQPIQILSADAGESILATGASWMSAEQCYLPGRLRPPSLQPSRRRAPELGARNSWSPTKHLPTMMILALAVMQARRHPSFQAVLSATHTAEVGYQWNRRLRRHVHKLAIPRQQCIRSLLLLHDAPFAGRGRPKLKIDHENGAACRNPGRRPNCTPSA